jgi:hypothetical protein
MKKAIVFTVFDRVQYLKETLDSWEQVRNINNYDIYFKIEPSDHQQGIFDVIDNFDNHRECISHKLLNKSIIGNGFNTWESFEYLFNKYDFVILAEDDIVVSKDIVEYFDSTEPMFRDDDEVAIISANTKLSVEDPSKVVRQQGFNGLVWGTWKKYWINYFRDNWDKDYSSDTEKCGWDWHLNLRIMPSNGLKNINPMASRSNHIGINGIHCDKTIFDETQSPLFKEDNVWDFIEEMIVVNL